MPGLPFDANEIKRLVQRFNAVMAREWADFPDRGGHAGQGEMAGSVPGAATEPGGNGNVPQFEA